MVPEVASSRLVTHPKVQVMIKVSGARRFHWGVASALGPLDSFQYDHDMSAESPHKRPLTEVSRPGK